MFTELLRILNAFPKWGCPYIIEFIETCIDIRYPERQKWVVIYLHVCALDMLKHDQNYRKGIIIGVNLENVQISAVI